ncbi:hypothetical protein PtB15_4B209 [Puccinia triticina]|nr:hypothetical protein PtB15_4B209 [Puccinia triticina]
MPPRKQTRDRILCTCVSRHCGSKQYWINGRWERGNLVVLATAKAHRLEDQAQAAESSTPEALLTAGGANHHDSSSGSSQPEVEPAEQDNSLAAVTNSLSLLRTDPYAHASQLKDVLDTFRSLTATEESKIHEQLATDIVTPIKWLKLNPVIMRMNCCSSCFATYPLDWTPEHCIHQDDRLDESEEEMAHNPSHICGTPLFKLHRMIKIPVQYFAYQSLNHWIARLLTRPGIKDALDQSLTSAFTPHDESGHVSDIHDIPQTELAGLADEHSSHDATTFQNVAAATDLDNEYEDELDLPDAPGFLDIQFGSNTDPSDTDFDGPDPSSSSGWGATGGENITDTWLKVKPLPPIPLTTNVFADLQQPHLQLHL